MLEMYTDRLTHIQQRIATIVAFTQRRGITTWVIAGVIGFLFENYLKKEMDSQLLNGRLIAEFSIFTFNLLYLSFALPTFVHSLLSKGDPRKVIIPPARLTGYFTLNLSGMLITAIVSVSSFYLILSGQNTSAPATCWANLFFHGYMSIMSFRNELKLAKGEILPGLHSYALRELTKTSIFPSILRGKILVILIVLTAVVLIVPVITIIVSIANNQLSSFMVIIQTKAFWPVLLILSLSIYMIIRESPFREIRSLLVLERLLMRFPEVSDAEFGFLLHATKWPTTFLSYAQFLINFNQRQFDQVTAEFGRVINLREKSQINSETGQRTMEYYDAVSRFNRVMHNFSEYNTDLILWLATVIPNVIGQEWKSLLDLERQRQATLMSYSQAVPAD